MDWTLAQIRAKVRKITGESDTSQLTDADLDLGINDYYCNKFPLEAAPQELETDFTLVTQPTDDGEYSLSGVMLVLEKPLYVNEQKIWLTDDRERFFKLYPADYGSAYCITKAQLAVGTTATKVANSAFSYKVSNKTYSKAAAETALSGSTIPQNKYGAWRLEIAADGTISVVEAAGNATGYATAAEAIAGLGVESSEKAAMGFVTAINTAGTFVPGTTALNAANVTSTFTDGFNSTRNTPVAGLLRGRVLTLRPKPNDLYILKAPVALKRPTAITQSSDTPPDPLWGPVIVYGTALERKLELGDPDAVQLLAAPYQYHLGFVTRKVIRQLSKTAQPKRTF